jgi:hypothetical protein
MKRRHRDDSIRHIRDVSGMLSATRAHPRAPSQRKVRPKPVRALENLRETVGPTKAESLFEGRSDAPGFHELRAREKCQVRQILHARVRA